MALQTTTKPFTFPKLCMRYIFSYYGLLLLNIAFLAVLAFAIADMAYLFMNAVDDTEEIEKILDGLATLFVAYGVALEEREFIMKIVGHYPQNQTSRETYIDHISHYYGVLLLIIGLVLEVVVQLTKIPDRFINVISFELPVFASGFLCLIVIGYWLIRFCYKLVTNAKLSPSCSINT